MVIETQTERALVSGAARPEESVSREHLELLNSFAIHLFEIGTEDDLAWEVVHEIVGKMGFRDCVFYYADLGRHVLHQAAALGSKNPHERLILNPLEIPFGAGITGRVAMTRRPKIVSDLSADDTYISDLEPALSEICVPIVVDDIVVGVIDCEDPRPNHFTRIHLLILTAVAAMAAGRLGSLRRDRDLKENQARLNGIVELAPEAIISTDVGLKVTLFNRGAERIFGFSAQEVLGRSLHALLPDDRHDDLDQLVDGLRRAHAPQEPENVRTPISGRRKNGEEFPAFMSIASYMLGADQMFTVMLQDIGDRVRIEEQVRHRDVLLRAIFDNCPTEITINDTDGRITNVSQSAADALNVDRSVAIGTTTADFFPPEIAERYMAADREVVRTGRSIQQEVKETSDNGTRYLLTSKFPLNDDDGEIIGICSMTSDITAIRETENDLRRAVEAADEANTAKSQFLANVSHELRTPLNSITGYAEMIDMQILGPVEPAIYREYAANILFSGRHLMDLVNQILDIERIEAGKYAITPEDINVAELFGECDRMVRPRADEKGIGMSFKFDATVRIHADRRAIFQVLVNLLSNAVKFTQNGGRVALFVSMDGDVCVLCVNDNGPGIPKDRLDAVKDPFSREESDPYKTQEGFGLGLSISNALIQLHDGELDISSEPGFGTTATVRLPL